MSFYWLFLFCAVAYAIGSISFSAIISRFLLKSDPTKLGSGALGATNMLRNYGQKVAWPVFFLDVAKGVVPALVGLLVFGIGTEAGRIALYACGVAAFMGHCFPFWNKFRGGKGTATAMGVFFVANPLLALVALVGTLVFGQTFRCGAMGSFFFMTSAVLWEGFFVGTGLTVSILLAVLYTLSMLMHRKNIHRLLIGTESMVTLIKKRRRSYNVEPEHTN